MESALRRRVRVRAGRRCEYCRLAPADAPFASFHVDHVVPRQHGGTDNPDNLALACYHCNLHKGSNLTGIDAESGQIHALFNPRRDDWSTRFAMQDSIIVGLTPIGRTTVRVLAMNAPDRVHLRMALQTAK